MPRQFERAKFILTRFPADLRLPKHTDRTETASRVGCRKGGIQMKMRIPLVVGAACLLQVLMTEPATAQTNASDYVTASIAVEHGDLDLSSQAGSDAMQRRVRQAAYRVCEGSSGRDLRYRREVRACVDNAMSTAMASANLTHYAAANAEAAPIRAVSFDANGARARVSYADLNLNSANGRAALDQRINSASRAVCGRGWLSRVVSRAQRNCMNEVQESAEQQVASIVSSRQMAAQSAPATTEVAALEPQSASQLTTTAAPTAQSASYGVCDARVHAATFNGAVLGGHARREIGYAVDAASVCQLDAAVIEADGSPASARRAQVLRAALISRGVPAERIQIVRSATATGAEVRMSFSGIAQGGEQTLHADAGV